MPDFFLIPLCVVSVMLIFFVTAILHIKTRDFLWTSVGFVATMFFAIGLQVYANSIHPEWVTGKHEWLLTYDTVAGVIIFIAYIITMVCVFGEDS